MIAILWILYCQNVFQFPFWELDEKKVRYFKWLWKHIFG